MTPDTIFSEDDGYEKSIDVNQIHDPGELEFIVHQNTKIPYLGHYNGTWHYLFWGVYLSNIITFQPNTCLREPDILVHQNI